jgi:hypothetical protein
MNQEFLDRQYLSLEPDEGRLVAWFEYSTDCSKVPNL